LKNILAFDRIGQFRNGRQSGNECAAEIAPTFCREVLHILQENWQLSAESPKSASKLDIGWEFGQAGQKG